MTLDALIALLRSLKELETGHSLEVVKTTDGDFSISHIIPTSASRVGNASKCTKEEKANSGSQVDCKKKLPLPRSLRQATISSENDASESSFITSDEDEVTSLPSPPKDDHQTKKNFLFEGSSDEEEIAVGYSQKEAYLKAFDEE